MTKLKIMTYNICAGLNGEEERVRDISAAAAVLRAQNADIVGLNEVDGCNPRSGCVSQMAQLAYMAGYPHCYFAQAIAFDGIHGYGNAILSKYPILFAETVGIPDPPVRDEDAYYETRAILRAKIGVGDGLTVLISHFGLAHSEQRNAVETACRLIDEERGALALMGDFNMEPEDETLAPLFARLSDTARADMKTFPSDEPRIKIDYIFLSKEIRCVCARVPRTRASDHCPYVAEVELPWDI